MNKNRECVLCGECSEPIGYPHLTPIEGIRKEDDLDPFWLYPSGKVRGIKGAYCVYHDGIFYHRYATKGEADEAYRVITTKGRINERTVEDFC